MNATMFFLACALLIAGVCAILEGLSGGTGSDNHAKRTIIVGIVLGVLSMGIFFFYPQF